MNINYDTITEEEVIDLLTNRRYTLSLEMKDKLEEILQLKYKNQDLELTGYMRYFRGKKEYYRNELEWNILCKYNNNKLKLTEEELKYKPLDFKTIQNNLDELEKEYGKNPMEQIEKKILINMFNYKEEDMW